MCTNSPPFRQPWLVTLRDLTRYSRRALDACNRGHVVFFWQNQKAGKRTLFAMAPFSDWQRRTFAAMVQFRSRRYRRVRLAEVPRAKRTLATCVDLYSQSGLFDAKKVARIFGVTLADLATMIGEDLQTLLKTPDSAALQPKLRIFGRIAGLRTLRSVTPPFFRRWINTKVESLQNKAPIDWIRCGKGEIVANLVDNLLLGNPG